MPLPSAAYSITLRVQLDIDPPSIGRVVTAIGETGGVVTAVDVAESAPDHLIADLTCRVLGEDHVELLVKSIELEGGQVHSLIDRTFALHDGGKLAVALRVPLDGTDELAMAYTPGVARVCRAIAERPADARRLTIRRNTVAVVTDGSAVLGLGNLGPTAALPVMEGKAMLFKRFADVDAWPICLDTQDVDELVHAVALLAPSFGGINLEDIAAPRCFEIERRLQELLDIPVFHDDQHGTAIVVLGALTNALKVVGKRLDAVRVAVCGAGAAGGAIVDMLQAEGACDLVVCDRAGILHPGRLDLNESKRAVAERTNSDRRSGSLRDALAGADVFIGVSACGVLKAEDLTTMARDPIVFALANPDPEIDPAAARAHAAVVATGRSDEPNQINNVLAFPGVFRGALDTGVPAITAAMKHAAAAAIADAVCDDELAPGHIVPSVFDPSVAPAVARAVAAAAARQTGRLLDPTFAPPA